MGRRKGKPRLLRHKTHQLGYGIFDGKMVYFGPWPNKAKTPPRETQDAFDRHYARWDARRQDVPEPVGSDPTIDELWLAYWRFCQGYYVKHGQPTSEADTIRQACRIAARLYGELPAREFGPKCLKHCRDEMVKAGWKRVTVNKQTKRVRGLFRWAVENELVAPAVLQSLQAVAPLKRGRTKAAESEKVRPVAWELVERTLPHLQGSVPDLVRVHWLLGCRAQDITIMRTCDLDQAAAPGLWRYTPTHADTGKPTSKTEHHEKDAPLTYWVGPKAQEVLRPLLRPDEPEAWLFPVGRKKGNGRRRGCYSTASYRRAITRACEANGLERWTPLRIRHARLTEIRARGWGSHTGAEASQAVARHSELSVTEIYAERSEELARRVMNEMG